MLPALKERPRPEGKRIDLARRLTILYLIILSACRGFPGHLNLIFFQPLFFLSSASASLGSPRERDHVRGRDRRLQRARWPRHADIPPLDRAGSPPHATLPGRRGVARRVGRPGHLRTAACAADREVAADRRVRRAAARVRRRVQRDRTFRRRRSRRRRAAADVRRLPRDSCRPWALRCRQPLGRCARPWP